MLERDRIAATVYGRSGDGWTHQIVIAGSSLALPEIGLPLPLTELYET